MSDIKELIRQRGNIRGRITLFENYLNPLLTLTSVDSKQKNQLTLRLNKLQELFCMFDDVQTSIENTDADTTKQLSEREETENKFYLLVAQAQDLLDIWDQKGKESSSSFNGIQTNNNVKLPSIKLPSFDGNPQKWLEFKDMFLSLIENNESIDAISKFHYLRSYLEGAASAVVNSVSVSSANYSIAWSLLCERYDNKRLLINEHIKCLFTIEPLPKESDKGLRNLIDTISKNISALNSLGEPTDKWDTLIIYMACSKLDSTSARNWEEFRSNLASPTLEHFFNFLRQRATVLETMQASKSIKNEKQHLVSKSKSFIASNSLDNSNKNQCLACKKDHKLYDCPKFKSMSIDERISKVYYWKLCANCLRSGHMSYQCRLGGCRTCKRKHNSLLHKEHKPINILTQNQNVQTPSTSSSSMATNTNQDLNLKLSSSSESSLEAHPSVTMSAVSSDRALLSTVLIEVTNNGNKYVLRALLDSGSQSSFISELAQKRIGLTKVKNHHHYVSGLNSKTTTITEHCDLNIKSLYSEFQIQVKCYIIPVITDKLPHAQLSIHDLGIPNRIQLADPGFYHPSKIDILLGADVFWEIMGSDKLKLGPNKPLLLDTQFGWVVAGPMGGNTSLKIHSYFSQDIKSQLLKFWESEEISSPNIKQDTNNFCEILFQESTRRESNGRFCVQIPLQESTEALGESFHIAKKCLFQLERKFKNSPNLKQQYSNFMQEYQNLGHMSEVHEPRFGCYLTHHAVIRENSETTKLRVVFNASAKTSSGVSFNDIQHVGPVVQDDLFSILIRYRQHQYVISADIEKMYRQILVKPNQRNLQRILWRDDDSQPVKIFELNTITYETASAPFLSTRCLLQLSRECSDPKIAQLIKEDCFVDDFLSGADTELELNHIYKSVTEVLASACLPLHKFRTNKPSILSIELDSKLSKNLELNSVNQTSTLGLKWNPVSDVFEFPVNIRPQRYETKRTILSNSAKLFDPLGLLSICTITPKIILQKLWLTNLEWDDPIPEDLNKIWNKFVASLNATALVKIPRCVITSNCVSIELHTFSDASEAAYAACVYIRSVNNCGEVIVRLLCAKTKVAPLKPTTIPRLELSGALLSARLSAKVLKALRCDIKSIFHWTDSSVVIGWLGKQPRDLQTYVSNRVSEIQELTASASWRHVPGKENPADLASRGIEPLRLTSTNLWWCGPSFLYKDSSSWPKNINISNVNLPETKTNTISTKIKPKLKSHNSNFNYKYTCVSTTQNNKKGFDNAIQFNRYSKLITLQRVLAYVLRFIYNLKNPPSKLSNSLTTDELNLSLFHLIKQHQLECFSDEINCISKKQNLPSKCRILSLNPFLDDKGILRVGGRLLNSSENYEKKHPILLEFNHNFTKLLFDQEHKKLLHCGPLLLLSSIRNQYWPIKGRILAKNTINNCKICRIFKGEIINPIMGSLPAPRVTPNLPFQVTGVDFAGPFLITDRKGRGCRITKSYLCLFVCFATKAVHLEAASDLSTKTFILCLERFIARRGKPNEIYCDNGTNFVGANNDINIFLKSNNEQISSYSANEGIKFKFSPAYSPHFGGLWEAGVKAAKHHLHRILGDRHFTFEELSTLYSQVEAILNSRPLVPLSSDPNDLLPLTPGHFLIGRPLTSMPLPTLIDVKMNKLNRYQHIDQMRQHFWQRWRNEYLCELQQRTKWKVNKEGLKVGDMVILKEAHTPPLQWRMGRVHRLYPGVDNVSRVADIMTAKGILRRALTKLILLPTNE